MTSRSGPSIHPRDSGGPAHDRLDAEDHRENDHQAIGTGNFTIAGSLEHSRQLMDERKVPC
jgi:hypothetical protein